MVVPLKTTLAKEWSHALDAFCHFARTNSFLCEKCQGKQKGKGSRAEENFQECADDWAQKEANFFGSR